MGARVEVWQGCALLAFPEREAQLREELEGRFGIKVPEPPEREKIYRDGETPKKPSSPVWFGPLLYLPAFELQEREAGTTANPSAYWARATMVAPRLMHFDSALDAAKELRAIQRNWASVQYHSWRRAELIVDKLPFVSAKPKEFPFELPNTPMGLFTLLGAHLALFSERTTDTAYAGTIALPEDHDNPPSRAYMKLQEALIRHCAIFGSALPGPGSRCLDAGACPGGWTWTLRQLGAEVYAIDRSPLVPELMQDRHVIFQSHDAFTLAPEELGSFDWVVSDVICYPARLLEWIERWIDSGKVRNMICTIKLQGGTDWEEINRFAAIPNSHIRHLGANKHELTWLWRSSQD